MMMITFQYCKGLGVFTFVDKLNKVLFHKFGLFNKYSSIVKKKKSHPILDNNEYVPISNEDKMSIVYLVALIEFLICYISYFIIYEKNDLNK